MLVHIKVPGIVGHLMGVILHVLVMETHLVRLVVVIKCFDSSLDGNILTVDLG